VSDTFSCKRQASSPGTLVAGCLCTGHASKNGMTCGGERSFLIVHTLIQNTQRVARSSFPAIKPACSPVEISSMAMERWLHLPSRHALLLTTAHTTHLQNTHTVPHSRLWLGTVFLQVTLQQVTPRTCRIHTQQRNSPQPSCQHRSLLTAKHLCSTHSEFIHSATQ
jgi:hypothetical protein